MIELIAQLTGWIGAGAFMCSDVFIAGHILRDRKTTLPLLAILAVLTGAGGNLIHELLVDGSVSQICAFALTLTCWGVALYFKLRKNG